MSLSITDTVAALSRWATHESHLIGVLEGRQLEFKKSAYRLDSERGKTEFAKDVAGMANAGGGIIVLGIETERDPTSGRDKSVRIRPLAPGSYNVPQMENV